MPPTDRVTASRSDASAGTSTPTTVAPSRASVRAIASPMPRDAPVTTTTRPVERPLRVGDLGGPGDVGADPHHLTGDERRPRREQEPQRGLDALLGAGRDQHELDGRPAAAELLAQRAGEALERALRGGGPRVAGELRRRPEDDDAPVAAQAAHQRVEERRGGATRSSLRAMPLASNTSAGRAARPRRRSTLGAGALEHVLHVRQQPAAGRAADDRRAREQRPGRARSGGARRAREADARHHGAAEGECASLVYWSTAHKVTLCVTECPLSADTRSPST